jgi:MscS family membrane protein
MLKKKQMEIKQKDKSAIIKALVNEKLVMLVVLVNSIVFVSLDVNPKLVETTGTWITWVDYICVIYFILEMFLKIYLLGFLSYFKSHWNKFDVVIVLASLPILLEPFFEALGDSLGWAPIFRITRLLRLGRFLRLSRIVRYVQYGDNLKKFQIPVYMILLTVASNITINLFDLTGEWLDNYYKFYPATIILFSTWLVSTIYKVFHSIIVIPFLQRDDITVNEAVEATFATLFQILIWGLGLSLTLESAGYDSTTILAGIGLGGMAVALAAQDFIANLIGGILLWLQRPFEVGQVIKISGHQGKVKKLGLRAILLEDETGNLTALPNKMFISQPLQNIAVSNFLNETISLKLDLDLDFSKLQQAIKIVQNIAIEYEHIDEDYTIKFDVMNDYCHNLVFEYFLDKVSLSNTNLEERLVELVNEANTFLYIEIVRNFNKNQIHFYKK